MELTRKQVIEVLEKADSTVYKEPKTKTAQALEYAISSLKTDEAYQLMYEGGEIFTKDEVVAMLKEIQLKITEKSYYDTTIIGNYEDEVRIELVELDDVNEVIQQKIDELTGE